MRRLGLLDCCMLPRQLADANMPRELARPLPPLRHYIADRRPSLHAEHGPMVCARGPVQSASPRGRWQRTGLVDERVDEARSAAGEGRQVAVPRVVSLGTAGAANASAPLRDTAGHERPGELVPQLSLERLDARRGLAPRPTLGLAPPLGLALLGGTVRDDVKDGAMVKENPGGRTRSRPTTRRAPSPRRPRAAIFRRCWLL
jgi:hypothetical protein